MHFKHISEQLTVSAYHLYGKPGKFRGEFKQNGSSRWKFSGKK